MVKQLVQRLPIPQVHPHQVWKMGVAISAVVLTGITTQVWFDRQIYRQGERAYAIADCHFAIAQFDRMLHPPRLFDGKNFVARAKIKRAECSAFLQMMDEQNVVTALLSYENFVSRYAESSLTKPAQQAAIQRFRQADPADLAQPALCNKLASFAAQQLISQPGDRLPRLQYACGQTFAQQGDPATAIHFYEQAIQNDPNHPLIQQINIALAHAKLAEAHLEADRGNYNDAIRRYHQFLTDYPDHGLTATAKAAMTKVLLVEAEDHASKKNYDLAIRQYSDFLQNYPDHPLEAEAKAALAQTMIARAETTGTKDIPDPQTSGSTLRGVTDVVIQNDSPNQIWIVLSGPETRIEELPPCPTCPKYTGVGPTACSTQESATTYRLKPGQYEVLVETSDSRITPFKGNWTLGNGTLYDSCFFTVIYPNPQRGGSAIPVLPDLPSLELKRH